MLVSNRELGREEARGFRGPVPEDVELLATPFPFLPGLGSTSVAEQVIEPTADIRLLGVSTAFQTAVTYGCCSTRVTG